MRKFTAIVLSALIFVVFPLDVQAREGNPVPTAAEAEELKTFRLTEDNLGRFIAAALDAQTLHVFLPETTEYSVGGLTKAIEASPTHFAIVAQHGFTPRQFAIIFTALTSAVITVLAREANDSVAAEGLITNEANIAFYISHRSQIDLFLGNSPPAAKK